MTTPGPSASTGPSAGTVAELLARLRASDPGRPRLTWYGAGGERVELSARVLENWVAKTANLLVEELDAVPGTRVHLDLPAHWRSAVWSLATAAVGALPAGREDAEVVVTDRTDAPAPAGALLVVVALPALALTAGPGLPPRAVDHNAEVAGYGDSVPVVAGATVLQVARALAPQERVLLSAEGTDPAAAAALLTDALAADGSLVLLGPGAPDADRVAAQEQVTLRA